MKLGLITRKANATARILRGAWATLKAVRWLATVLAVLGILALGRVESACTAAQRAAVATDASALGPYLEAGCAYVDTAGNPWLDFICAGAQASDGLVAKLPGAAVVSSTNVVDTSGNPVRTLYRVRCPLAALKAPSDAAAADVMTAGDVVRSLVEAGAFAPPRDGGAP